MGSGVVLFEGGAEGLPQTVVRQKPVLKMTSLSSGIFDAVAAAWDVFDAKLIGIGIAQDNTCNDDEYESLESEAAQVCADKERETCQIAGIPYHGWAHDVHRCARWRDDRQTLDMAKELKDRIYDHKHAYALLCFAMMKSTRSPYFKLVWGCEPQGVPGE